MNPVKRALLATFLICNASAAVHAALVPAGAGITPPASVLSNGATNSSPQGFNEIQGRTLVADLQVNGGVIPAGTVVDSHMIFLNPSPGNTINYNGASFTFDGDILGVMSDSLGTLEVSSSALLGAPGTVYPNAGYPGRGLEIGTPMFPFGSEGYSVSGKQLGLSLQASGGAGDWVRVVTRHVGPVQTGYSITDLGTLGGVESHAIDVNNNGQVLADYRTADNRWIAAVWNKGVKVDIGGVRAREINDNQQVTGGYGFFGGAFFWSPVGGLVRLPVQLLPDGRTLTPYEGRGINKYGQVTGASSLGGFVWDPIAGFSVLDGFQGDDITDDGTVMLANGALWKNGQVLGKAIDGWSMNNKLDIVSVVFGNCILWTPATGSKTFATDCNGGGFPFIDINQAGDVVGGTTAGAAFIYKGGVRTDLNTMVPAGSGWKLEIASGINDRGQISGTGVIGGVRHAFLLTPAAVPAVPSYAHTISGMSRFALGLKPDGRVFGAGNNDGNQLGDGTYINSTTPILAIGITGVKSVATGSSHVVALKQDGSVWSWGNGRSGQLGRPITYPSVPAQIPGLTNVASIAAGPITGIVVKTDGTVWQWGNTTSSGAATSSPVQVGATVVGFNNIVTVDSGGDSNCSWNVALKADGTLWGWGCNPPTGPWIANGAQNVATPTVIPGITNVVGLSINWYNTMAVTADGGAWIWGNNAYGQLVDGTTSVNATPRRIPGLANVKSVASGDRVMLALLNDGSVWSWGSNVNNQLGTGVSTTATQRIPQMIPGLSNVVEIVNGYNMKAKRTDGVVLTWGANSSGQAGDGSVVPHPTPTPSLF